MRPLRSISIPPTTAATPDAEPYPLWIKPDHKLSVADVMALMRDHYEGTPYDMTQGVDAGPYGTPNRWRPMAWEVDGRRYTWERPISTQQTGFSLRLPVPLLAARTPSAACSGTAWTTPILRAMCPCTPASIGCPSPTRWARSRQFSWDSAWWVFNFVANIANLKYSYMVEDILAVQRELEGQFLAMQPVVEQAALALSDSDPALMTEYLTQYSVGQADEVVRRWKSLGEFLLTKYNDGYVATDGEESVERGYPQEWLGLVGEQRPEQFRLARPEENLTDLPY